uniref:CHK kinase-like domain-containing protein n=1 Tax=Clastoptera arizonana TaxID=38151 RepID=A0A1B6DMZ3_9HEMI
MKEHEIPSWLNQQYLQSILVQKIPGEVLSKYEIEPAVPGGNNNCSRMWRIKLYYNDGSSRTSIMVKAPVPDGLHKDVLDEGKFSYTEDVFYKRFIPFMTNISLNTSVLPKSYSSGVQETLVLEDLKEEGYAMCDRIKRLDFEHCRVVMESLGEFHALSVAVRKRDPDLIQDLGNTSFVRGNRSGGVFHLLRSSLVGFSELIKTWPGFERFDYISEDKVEAFFDRTADMFLPSSGLNVLCHGDLWTTNVMFKYDAAGAVIAAKFVDFQLCTLRSPATDLHFFALTSMRDDVRETKLRELHTVYLESLNKKLREFGCEERLSQKQLGEELSRTRFLGFYILCVMLPIFFRDEIHDFDIEEILKSKSEKPFLSQYSSKHYKEVAPTILKELEDVIFENLNK